jgi:hypothetical protein
MARVYAIKPEVVDKVLGAGIYSNWQKIQEAFIAEETRSYANDRLYSHPWAADLRKQLQADLAFAEKVADDYLTFLERATANATGDVTEGEKILDVFVLAISILNSVNDLLDDMFALGIVALFTALAGARLETEARALQALLKRLQVELEKAKREASDAVLQLGIDVALTAIAACMGPLGWLGLGVFAVAHLAADTYLGPSTSDAATWGSRGNTALGTAASASRKYLEATSKVVRVAKPAGKIIPVIGFAFDVNEIAVGYSNVDGLRKLMADTKTVHEQMIDNIRLHKATIDNLFVKLEVLHKQTLHRTDGWTAGIRQTLEAEMRRTGYRPRV